MYTILGSDAEIFNFNKVRFTSNAEVTLSFSLVATAIGENPSTLTIPTTVKIVDCSNGNAITGSTWDDN